ncbi:acetyl-CoA carboxylase carboxyl transferase subunit beta [Sporobacter termitidis DSM 10068]|uniref:Acetyl-CoA carboxylase carboxyl transferase subunit beta n=1 Tax=Sporobacter termitidis DSM 10068 TaxID=1123282 RepID=A0A1M5ZEM8_9FIRM|nr:acetyl-CoA carboxylase carboxyltransferase subunit beta [Sporobacter termitidis]SHI22602.1 acetyl-CoA carboxylase carboxyl transferase subunit beta [Sporobacter termitidis DSM 10068]
MPFMTESTEPNSQPKTDIKTAREKLKRIVDDNSFSELDRNLLPINILRFPGYDEKLKKARASSSENEAVISGFAAINKQPCIILIFEPLFMMGSMGSVVGEKITRAFELAIKKKLPVITITASGGARMQEGVYSLMQMSKTASAVYRHSQQGLLYISVLSNPTLGGVTASFASLGDIVIAEENAQIGFTGKRIIEETTRTKLSDDFQSARFIKEHGFADMVAQEEDLRPILAKLLQLHA